MRVALVTGGLPRPLGVEVVAEGGPEVDVAAARGWEALDALVACEAGRRVLVVGDLDEAPLAVDAPVVLVAGGRWLADLLGGDRTRVLRPFRPSVADAEPRPLTRGDLAGEVVVDPEDVDAVLAAFAAGHTVVAADTPALREVVTDGFDGVLVPGGGARALRRAVRDLDRDRVRLHLLRHNAWHTAKAWPAEAQQATVLEAILRAVAREPAPEPPGAIPRPPGRGGLLARLLGR